MRATNLHSSGSFLVRLWNLSFLCCFFVFFLFRNEVAYTVEHLIESAHLGMNYELGDDFSSEIEIEKQEVILSNVFASQLKASLFIEEQLIKNSITSQGNVLSAYLEVHSPPPWSAA